MLLIQLDETSAAPLYRQILQQIRKKIESRALRPGSKLPSTRRLAEKLEIHRSTVSLAYQELWALGYIDLHPGSRPKVRVRTSIATPETRQQESIIDWNSYVSTTNDTLWQTFCDFDPPVVEGDSLIDFSRINMDFRLLPLDSFRTCLNRSLKNRPAELFGYGPVTGYPPLRRYIAHRLQAHGISVTEDELLLTNGSQHGIDLVFRMLSAPGRSIAIGSPSYDCMLPLLRFSGMKPLEIPLQRNGMDLDALEQTIMDHKPSLVYTMPNFQNPTGVSTSQAHRERLLSLAEQHRIPILEDGFEEEMKYFGREVLPIKSMDKHHLVIYVGTFSKVLFPGVRIGWIAAGKQCIERLAAIHRFSEISSSMILQAGMYEFCNSGGYDRHVSKMHRVYRKRMQTAIRELHRFIQPEWAQWQEPNGGYLIWLKLKPMTCDAGQWQEILTDYSVRVAWGEHFFMTPGKERYCRISISTLNQEEITEGIQRLGKALASVYKI